MAIEKVIDIKIQGNTDQAIGTLRQQLKAAVAEVQNLSEAYGENSRQAIEAAKKAAAIKDRIEDANDAILAFKGEGTFLATSKALTSVASGFTAVQGGMALFGAESENVQATLLKVQSAMALSQGLAGLEDAGRSFKQLGAVANDVFKSIKGAIGATGIGLLVVALGTVVAYWDDIAKAIDGATDESKAYKAVQDQVTASIAKVEENLINVKIAIDQAKDGTISKEEALKKYNDTLGTAFGKTDDLRIAEERMIANTENYVKAQTLRAAGNLMIAKAAEAAAKAASGEDIKTSFWQDAQSSILGVLSPLEKAKQQAKAAIDNINENAKEQAKYTNLGTNLLNEAAQLEVKIGAEKNNKLYEQNQKRIKELEDLEKKAAEKKIADYEKDKAETIKQSEDVDELTYSLRKGTIDKVALLNTESIAVRLKEQQDAANKEVEIEKQKEAAKQDIRMQGLDNVASIGRSLQVLAGKNKDVARAGIILENAAGIARIVVNTMIGNAKAVAAFPLTGGQPFVGINTVAGGLSIAASIKATQTALSQIGGGGNVGSSPSMSAAGGAGGAGATAPQFNVVGNTGVNQLAGVIGNKEAAPVQSYVLANNVTTAQSLQRNIIQSATLGG
jgi:hypothetical protein